MSLVLKQNDDYITSLSQHEGEYVGSGSFGMVRRIKVPVRLGKNMDTSGDQKKINKGEDHDMDTSGNQKKKHVVRKRIKCSDTQSIYGGLVYSSVRECTVLKNFSHHPHIIQHQGMFVHPNGTVDILLPEYEMDLFDWTMQTHHFQTRVDKVPYFLRCLSSALVTMHQTGYLHRDIKPKNILLDPSSEDVCLIDFNSSRCMSLSYRDHPMNEDDTHKVSTLEYCVFPLTKGQTTFPYRPPETNTCNYNTKSDIYSLGCTMIYVIVRSFPFMDEWAEYNKKHYNDKDKNIEDGFKHNPTHHDWLDHLNRYRDFLNSSIFSILKRMIHPDPQKRPSAQEIFQQFSHDSAPIRVLTSPHPTNPTGVLEGLARNAFLRFMGNPYNKSYFLPYSVYVGIRLFQRIYPLWKETYADISMRPRKDEEDVSENTTKIKKTYKNRRERNIQAKYDDFNRKLFDMSTIWYLMFACCSIAEHFLNINVRVRTSFIIDVMRDDQELTHQQKMTEELFTKLESRVFILADCCVWWGKLDVEPFAQHLLCSNVSIEQIWKKVVYVLMFKT